MCICVRIYVSAAVAIRVSASIRLVEVLVRSCSCQVTRYAFLTTVLALSSSAFYLLIDFHSGTAAPTKFEIASSAGTKYIESSALLYAGPTSTRAYTGTTVSIPVVPAQTTFVSIQL